MLGTVCILSSYLEDIHTVACYAEYECRFIRVILNNSAVNSKLELNVLCTVCCVSINEEVRIICFLNDYDRSKSILLGLCGVC